MFKQFLKRQTTAGLRSEFRKIWREFIIFRKHRVGLRIARKFFYLKHQKLHIGCGSNLKSGWVNIDFDSKADLALDMREPLPFSENSCRAIYSEHFVEHLSYPQQANSFFKECYRVLEQGGLFSAGVPDTEWPIVEYSKPRFDGYFSIAKNRWHPAWCQTKMEHINHHFREGGDHLFAYDFQTFAKALVSVGFEKVQRREFDAKLDSPERQLGTLYLNAFKR